MREIREFVWRKHALERMLQRSIARDEVILCAMSGEIMLMIIPILAVWFYKSAQSHYIL